MLINFDSAQQFLQVWKFWWLIIKTCFNTSFLEWRLLSLCCHWKQLSSETSAELIRRTHKPLKTCETGLYQYGLNLLKWSESSIKSWLVMSVFWRVLEWGPMLCNTLWNMSKYECIECNFRVNLPAFFHVCMEFSLCVWTLYNSPAYQCVISCRGHWVSSDISVWSGSSSITSWPVIRNSALLWQANLPCSADPLKSCLDIVSGCLITFHCYYTFPLLNSLERFNHLCLKYLLCAW